MKIGLAPFSITPGKLSRNLEKMAGLVAAASKHSCGLVVFPEMSDVGEDQKNWKRSFGFADTIPGQSTDILKSLAQRNKIDIIAGLLERDGNDVYSSAVYISGEGYILHRHRQVSNGFPYSCGLSFDVFKSPFGTAMIAICGDLFLAKLADSVRLLNPDFIIVPMDFCRDDDEPRDIEPYFLGKWMDKFSELTKNYNITLVAVNALSDDMDGYAGACGGAFVFKAGNLLDRLSLYSESLLITQI